MRCENSCLLEARADIDCGVCLRWDVVYAKIALSPQETPVKWVHLTTAPDQLQAEMWRHMLTEGGISAVVRPGDTASFLGVSAYPCRIMVAQDQRERAREVLDAHLGGDGELEPESE